MAPALPSSSFASKASYFSYLLAHAIGAECEVGLQDDFHTFCNIHYNADEASTASRHTLTPKAPGAYPVGHPPMHVTTDLSDVGTYELPPTPGNIPMPLIQNKALQGDNWESYKAWNRDNPGVPSSTPVHQGQGQPAPASAPQQATFSQPQGAWPPQSPHIGSGQVHAPKPHYPNLQQALAKAPFSSGQMQQQQQHQPGDPALTDYDIQVQRLTAAQEQAKVALTGMVDAMHMLSTSSVEFLKYRDSLRG
ncbi:uncharacterized protein CCOS01_08482 [Colletotrichum costaricense]|uniref:Uncharacterized protein n=1 Tax=Colletotrichum costaricense TaxID=1209916 RepID=A0AAI9YVH7_9PEZI|nr:uncharacterized protein CCOS01_08482 [Colletotrichum costaricense]KAK1526064.1 hypothetical protein CCOS01_08482 [Colletotrichum costaricense]